MCRSIRPIRPSACGTSHELRGESVCIADAAGHAGLIAAQLDNQRFLDPDALARTRLGRRRTLPDVAPEALAYVIHTSGPAKAGVFSRR